MSTIYVLQCEKGRYYIGKTNRSVIERLSDHLKGKGSEWTTKYKPINIVETIESTDEFDEDKYTKKYMKLYGINNVRGGSYTQMDLPEYSILALEKELCSASNTCFRCYRQGHFAKDCHAKTKVDGSPIYDSESDYESSDSEYEEVFCCEK